MERAGGQAGVRAPALRMTWIKTSDINEKPAGDT